MFFELTPDEVIAVDDSGTLSVAKAAILIEDTQSRAVGLVPELAGELTELQFKASRAIIRKAVLRWHQTGSGAVVQQSLTTGSYSESSTLDTKQTDRAIFTQNELKELKNLFPKASTRSGRAFSVDLF